MRLFAAISLPARVIAGLSREQASLARFGASLRLVEPSGLHITLCFIGDVEMQAVEVIEHGIRAVIADESPFILAMTEGGSFPGSDDARVVWMGLDGELRRLSTLQNLIANEIRSVGYRIDPRPFSPHVTLARVSRNASRSERRSIAESASDLSCYGLKAFEVRSVDLTESLLDDNRATYSTVAQIPLTSTR